MNGKKIFCLSLIILSVAMGIHWFKHRPKIKKKTRRRPRVALNIEDLQILDDKDSVANPKDNKTSQDSAAENSHVGNQASSTLDVASSSTNLLNASDTLGLNKDPVIFAFNNLKRNPFERSPYVLLAEKAKKQSEEVEIEDLSGKGKETKLLKANFTATIRTDRDLVAVIDTRLYRKGDRFKSGKISSISTELVFVKTPSTLFIIPKVGVNLQVATDGVYTYEDNYRD